MTCYYTHTCLTGTTFNLCQGQYNKQRTTTTRAPSSYKDIISYTVIRVSCSGESPHVIARFGYWQMWFKGFFAQCTTGIPLAGLSQANQHFWTHHPYVLAPVILLKVWLPSCLLLPKSDNMGVKSCYKRMFIALISP